MRKLINRNNFHFYIAALIGIIAIIFGTFFDQQIATNITDTNSVMGKFVESFGLFPVLLPITICGVLFFIGLKNRKNGFLKVLAWLGLFVAFGLGTYFYYHELTKANEYAQTISKLWGLLLSLVLTLLATIGFYFLFRKVDQNDAIRLAIMMLIVELSFLLIMEVVKNLASRPRFRYVLTGGAEFKNWYEFTPFTAKNDNFKSFPSGHTGFATTTLSIALLANLKRKDSPVLRLILQLGTLIFAMFIAFMRMRYGAHYLSDVGFGMLIVSSLEIIFYSIFIKEKYIKI